MLCRLCTSAGVLGEIVVGCEAVCVECVQLGRAAVGLRPRTFGAVMGWGGHFAVRQLMMPLPCV